MHAVLRVGAWGAFVVSTVKTMKKNPVKSGFYVPFGVLGSLWIGRPDGNRFRCDAAGRLGARERHLFRAGSGGVRRAHGVFVFDMAVAGDQEFPVSCGHRVDGTRRQCGPGAAAFVCGKESLVERCTWHIVIVK